MLEHLTNKHLGDLRTLAERGIDILIENDAISFLYDDQTTDTDRRFAEQRADAWGLDGLKVYVDLQDELLLGITGEIKAIHPANRVITESIRDSVKGFTQTAAQQRMIVIRRRGGQHGR